MSRRLGVGVDAVDVAGGERRLGRPLAPVTRNVSTVPVDRVTWTSSPARQLRQVDEDGGPAARVDVAGDDGRPDGSGHDAVAVPAGRVPRLRRVELAGGAEAEVLEAGVDPDGRDLHPLGRRPRRRRRCTTAPPGPGRAGGPAARGRRSARRTTSARWSGRARGLRAGPARLRRDGGDGRAPGEQQHGGAERDRGTSVRRDELRHGSSGHRQGRAGAEGRARRRAGGRRARPRRRRSRSASTARARRHVRGRPRRRRARRRCASAAARAA